MNSKTFAVHDEASFTSRSEMDCRKFLVLFSSSLFLMGASKHEKHTVLCPADAVQCDLSSAGKAARRDASPKDAAIGGAADPAALTKAIEANPASAAAYLDRAEAYGRKGAFDKALADFDKALELQPNSAVAHNGRGACWIKKGDYERAISELSQAIELDPKNLSAHFNRAAAYKLTKQTDKAIADYRAAIAIDDRATPAKLELARLVRPVFWEVDFEGEPWKYWGGGVAAPAEGGLLGVYLPEGQSQGRWQEVLEQEYIWRSGESLDSFFKAYIARLKQRLPGTKALVISQSKEGMMFEHWHVDEAGGPAEHSIRRWALRPEGIYTIDYTKRTPKLEEDVRQKWIDRLNRARLNL